MGLNHSRRGGGPRDPPPSLLPGWVGHEGECYLALQHSTATSTRNLVFETCYFVCRCCVLVGAAAARFRNRTPGCASHWKCRLISNGFGGSPISVPTSLKVTFYPRHISPPSTRHPKTPNLTPSSTPTHPPTPKTNPKTTILMLPHLRLTGAPYRHGARACQRA